VTELEAATLRLPVDYGSHIRRICRLIVVWRMSIMPMQTKNITSAVAATAT
jgi:hypothetical protein